MHKPFVIIFRLNDGYAEPTEKELTEHLFTEVRKQNPLKGV